MCQKIARNPEQNTRKGFAERKTLGRKLNLKNSKLRSCLLGLLIDILIDLLMNIDRGTVVMFRYSLTTAKKPKKRLKSYFIIIGIHFSILIIVILCDMFKISILSIMFINTHI